MSHRVFVKDRTHAVETADGRNYTYRLDTVLLKKSRKTEESDSIDDEAYRP